MTTEKKKTGYDADDMQALEGLEAVRKRMGMYIGSNGTKGKTHLVYEIFDNSVDEALAGYCKNITIVFYPDASIEVYDDGRGIPVDINTKTGLSGIELVLTRLHAGGKFGGGGYKSAGGLHGVGASVVNALSQRLDATVYRDGKKYEMSFHRGSPVIFKTPGPSDDYTPHKGIREVPTRSKNKQGTTIRYWPDHALFTPDAVTDIDAVVARARQTAFLVPGLTIHVKDMRDPGNITEETFRFSGGVKDMADFLSPDKPLCDTVHVTGSGTFMETVPVLDDKGHMVNTDVERTVEVDVAYRWGTGYDANIHCFVNVVSTPIGGTHQKGFERALVNTIRKGYDGTRLMKQGDDPVTLDDITEGLTAVVSVNVPEPQFVGQTKEELGTPGVLKVVQDVVAAGVRDWMEGKKKNQARTVLEKIANAAKNRVAARTQREAARRKTSLESASMPAKLVDCRATGVNRSELFVVEGDSALGSARGARDSQYQALLPIRGKILNVQKASLAQMLANVECASIIQVIGAGSGKTFDLDAMRYHRIIIMADADVDGAHIRCLLITLFLKYMRPALEAGRIYTAVPPLHKVTTMGKNGDVIYTYSQEEMERTVAQLEASGKTVKKPIPRFKGLGEMDASELNETTMQPDVRTVRQITVDDAKEAEAVLELLMGNEVPPRRDWIIENAHRVSLENIDT